MSTVGVPLKLSDTSPDFESLVLQLQLFLDSKGTWSDVLPSSLGQTLIEMMAAVGAFNQFAIESALREAFLTTAKRQSSVYAVARMLGVRLVRKVQPLCRSTCSAETVQSKRSSPSSLSSQSTTKNSSTETTSCSLLALSQ